MNDVHFDNYQFEGRVSKLPASAETNIAFTDYERMHTERHHANPASWIPPFALNDKQLREVLLLRAWRYIHGHSKPAAEDREKINLIATARALAGHSFGGGVPAIQREMVKKHIVAVRKAGGFLQLHAAIAFRSWRLGMNSVEVAESLGMTPYAVRVALWRLRSAAKDLNLDVGRAGYTAGMKLNRKRKSRA